MSPTKPTSINVRISPETQVFIEQLKTVMDRHHGELLAEAGIRRYSGKITDASALHIAVELALSQLDPDHVRRHPLPSEGPGHLEIANKGEIVAELTDLKIRLNEIVNAISHNLVTVLDHPPPKAWLEFEEHDRTVQADGKILDPAGENKK